MIRKGNNKFKTLHKGSELVTRVFKGDELIYQDIDALYSFKFTIDTRKTQTGGSNTNKTFSLSFNNLEREQYSVPYDPVLIDWGDGETTTTSNPSGQSVITFQHTYATAGQYQIKLLPTVFSGGAPSPGWLSGLSLTSDVNNAYRVLSIDKIFPEGSYNYSFHDNSRVPYRRCGIVFKLENMRNLKYAPTDLFKNVNIIPVGTGTPYGGSKFQFFAHYCGNNVTMANFNCDVIGILKTLLDKFDPNEMAQITDYSSFFRLAFDNTKIKKQIPADFFSNIHTDAATDLRSMFQDTFSSSWVAGSENATIPAGLFDTIVTSHATSVWSMFEGTFEYAFSTSNGNAGSTTATIPDRLLPLDYSSVTGTNAENLFNGTFAGAMSNSTAVSIPEHIFDGLKLPNITSTKLLFAYTFSGMQKSSAPIPSTLFSNVTISQNLTDMSEMFEGTFQRIDYTSGTANTTTLPSGLFDFVDTSHATNITKMFYRTFSGSYRNSTVISIPSGLFDCVDLSNTPSYTSLFNETFGGFGTNSQAVNPIPADIFSTIDTSGYTGAQSLFFSTFNAAFMNDVNATIPEGIFDALDTSSFTSTGQLFYSTFASFGKASTIGTIPANIFSNLDFTNLTSCSEMFEYTFASYATKNTSGTIPAGLFSAIAAPNCTNMLGMFAHTFDSCFKESTVATIPSGLFSALSTANVTTMQGMFEGTFMDACYYSNVATIPSTLFSAIDTTSCTNFYNMFKQTFYRCIKPTNPITLPSTFFSTIDTSNATSTSYMFQSTFDMTALTDVPQGIFGGITVPSAHSYMFSNTFACNSYYQGGSGDYSGMVLNDPFDGMSDFSWASASDTTALNSMFQTGRRIYGQRYQWLIGAASTVLQHFNFTPASDTNMFQWQDQLTDYSTINANWK